METIVTIGLDLAKSVFQVHAVDAFGNVVVRRAFRRANLLDFFRKAPRCLVGMEACATAHFWAREIQACGHDVRIIPPIYVKAYVKRSKTDAADAEAICEAVTRPTMRFVPIKSEAQQAAGIVLKTRELLVRQRTQTANALRAHMMEFGIAAAKGMVSLAKVASEIRDPASQIIPASALRWSSLRSAARPGALRSINPCGPDALNLTTQSRMIWSVTPAISAASVRLAPS